METGDVVIGYVITSILSYWIGYLHRFFSTKEPTWQKKKESKDG